MNRLATLLAICLPVLAAQPDPRPLALIQRHPIDSSHVYTYHTEGFVPGGGLYVLETTGQLRKLVDSPKGQILDCDISYDGREILFSWRKSADDGYHLYTIRADGSGLKQITDGEWHDYNACYLPDGGIAFLSTRSVRFAYCWVSPVGLLHRMDRDGANVVRLSANIVNDFTPSVMPDGRLIYSRWEYVDKPAIPIQSLWTINPDGTALAGFFGNRVLSPATFMEARAIPGTGQVLCVLTSHNGPARGAIGIIDPVQGNNAQAAIRNITPEVNIGQVDKGNGNSIRGPYESPFPLNERWYLVSKSGTILLREYDGKSETVLATPRDGIGFYNARPLAARNAPPVVPSRISPEQQDSIWATVYVEDVYAGLEPYVQRGQIKQIAVVQEMEKAVRTDVKNRAFGFQFPVISCGATYAAKTVWGFAPVLPDGSAHFQVPANVPIYFLALDAEGRALQRMRTFTHLMPGETQGCVGCHEPRNISPVARKPMALTSDALPLAVPEWSVRGFDYSALVQPVLDQHCASCHTGPTPAGKVDLSGDKTDFFNVSYETLARGHKRSGEAEWDSPFTSWIPTFNGMEANILQVTPLAWGSPRSLLADLILSGHPDKAGKPMVNMDDASRRRIFTWIDLNVPYYDNPGCRRIYPDDLDKTLAEVAARRCVECHKSGRITRPIWTRITRPELNNFLIAPLSVSAGGSGACGKPVFADTRDPDYQAILRTFDPIRKMLRDRPRMDMPGAKPAVCDVTRK